MNFAIIAAGGRGTRVGGARAKQFLEVGGAPVVVHTLRRFDECATVSETVVVVPPGEVKAFLELAETYGLRKPVRVVAGGATRAESVWRGLSGVGDRAEVVAVHDAVRPLVTPDEIDRTVRAAALHGAALLAARAVDTIKEAGGADDEAEAGGPAVARTLERSRLWHAQTPQCFRLELLRRAYERALAEGAEATDCSALVERLGVRVRLVEGGARNIKITTPEDLALAEILLVRGAGGRGPE